MNKSVILAVLLFFAVNTNSQILKRITRSSNVTGSGFIRIGVSTRTNGNGFSIVKVSNSNTSVTLANSFYLSSPATTSAGVYKTDGTLVRTLWSGEYKNTGTYVVSWDGTDDNLVQLPNDNYTLKVLSNNVQATWEGVIGNTSTSLERQQIYSSLDAPNRIEIVGTRAYYLVGYNEGQASVAAFDLNNIQVRQDPFNGAGGVLNSVDMAIDGNKIYLATQSDYHTQYSFVYARSISDGSIVNFSAGTSYSEINPTWPPAGQTALVANYRTDTISPTGITVSSSYIFVSYKGRDAISVLDKTTGALVREIPLSSPSSIIVDGSYIWVTTGNTTISKYFINADGSFGAISAVISGLSNVVNIKVGGGLLGVVDGGISQQIKAYNTSNGSYAWTLGQLGGVLNSPVISDDRFGFWLIVGNGIKVNRGGIAFQSDGSFWVIDASNGRMMHFSSNRTFIESIRYMQHIRTCSIVGNDSTQILGNAIQFKVNYTSPLSSAWTPTYNWEGKMSDFTTEEWIRTVNKLSNGRYYGLVNSRTGNPSGGGGGIQVVELDTVNGLRYTNTWASNNLFSAIRMYPNGDLYGLDNNGIEIKWAKQSLQSFDVNGDPVYSSAAPLSVTLPITSGSTRLSGPYPAPREITSSGVLVLYSGDYVHGESLVPHLAGMNPTTGTIIWKTMPSTYHEYKGFYPKNGFDIGNNVDMGNIGSAALARDKFIFTGYPAEGYNAGQANKYNIYYDDGLYIGEFGVIGQDFVDSPTVYPGMAGNAYYFFVTKAGINYYLYHGDESVHGGVHRWKITGLNNVQEQIINITPSFVRTSEKVVAPQTYYVFDNLPYRTDITGTSTGTYSVSSFAANDYAWYAKTNIRIFEKRKTPDVDIYYNSINKKDVVFSLGANSNLTNWEAVGKVSYNGENPNYWDTSGANVFVDILDNTGKIILRVYQISDVNHLNTIFKVNSTTMFTKDTHSMQVYTSKPKTLDIKKVGSSITVTYDTYSTTITTSYDAGADISSPSNLREEFYNRDGASGSKWTTLYDWILKK